MGCQLSIDHFRFKVGWLIDGDDDASSLSLRENKNKVPRCFLSPCV